MRYLLVFFLIFLSLNSYSDCIKEHLKAAIKINTVRKPMYSKLTHGKSDKISDRLIQGEKISLIYASYLEYLAKPYWKEGIAIFCDEFISLDNIPEFKSKDLTPDPIYIFHTLEVTNLRAKMYKAYESNDFLTIEQAARKHLNYLRTSSTYYSMTKHTLESIILAAKMSKQHIHDSKIKGLKNPKKILMKNIRIQIFILSFAMKLDRDAAPLQAEGVKIITQDIPHIVD